MLRARWFATLALAFACGEAPPPAPREMSASASELEPWSDAWLLREGERFLTNTTYRRAALEHSLVNPENLYSRQRLASYGLAGASSLARGPEGLQPMSPMTRSENPFRMAHDTTPEVGNEA